MKSTNEIIKLLEKQKPYLRKKYKIKALSIFGSYLRNEAGKDSDIDILVEFDQSPGLEFVDLAEELEEMLGVKVDLVSKNGIKPKYYNKIEQDIVHV